MATKNIKHEVATTTHFIPVNEVVYDVEENYGRAHSHVAETPKLDELEKSLTTLGWRRNDLIQGCELSPEEVVKYHAMLVAEYERLREAAESPKATDREKLRFLVWSKVRVDKASRVRKPKYLGLTGNQRFSRWLEACVDRLEGGIKHGWGYLGVSAPLNEDTGEPMTSAKPEEYPELWIITEIPMEIKHYASLAERIEDQVAENNLKLTGNTPMTRLDLAVAGQKLIDLNGGELPTESEMARKLSMTKRGEIQDVYNILAINYYGGEELDYLNRVCMPDDQAGDPRYLNYTFRLSNNWDSKMKARSNLMINRMDPKWVDEKRIQMKTNGKPESEWPEHGNKKDFVEYFNWRPTQEFQKSKQLPFSKMESAAVEYGVDFLNDFFEGAARSSMDDFEAAYKPLFQLINLICKLCGRTDPKIVASLLVHLNMEEDPTALIEEWLEFFPDEQAVATGTVIESRFIAHEPEVVDSELVTQE